MPTSLKNMDSGAFVSSFGVSVIETIKFLDISAATLRT